MMIPLKQPFNFENAVKSHGWWMLAPNHWNEKEDVYSRTLHLENGKNVLIAVTYEATHLVVDIKTDRSLNSEDIQSIQQSVKWIFRLEEDFESFYALTEEHNELTHLSRERKGRLLRSPTLFEDVVKVILTTNTRWQQTINMTSHLVNHLGETVQTTGQNEFKTFPTAARILEAGEDYLKKHIRVGYRSAYLIDAATKAVDPSFNLESFKSPKKNLKPLNSIKGVGPYAFSTLSMLLGRYDSLPVDSVYKHHVVTKYFNNEKSPQKVLEEVYDHWENYKFLAYWFDE